MLTVAAGAPVDEIQLVYSPQNDPAKSQFAQNILNDLKQINANVLVNALPIHTDKNSLAVLKIKKPNTDSIVDVDACCREYQGLYQAQLKGDLVRDFEVKRSSVFHAFRAELESWHIERYWVIKGMMGLTDGEMIPARLARLLDDPYLAQAFVKCLATGAVEPVNGTGWVWHAAPDGKNDVLISNWMENPNADLIRAMVVFCLQQKEDRPGSLKTINARPANKARCSWPSKRARA